MNSAILHNTHLVHKLMFISANRIDDEQLLITFSDYYVLVQIKSMMVSHTGYFKGYFESFGVFGLK